MVCWACLNEESLPNTKDVYLCPYNMFRFVKIRHSEQNLKCCWNSGYLQFFTCSRPQEQDIRMSLRCISLLSNYFFIDPPMPSIDPCVSVITWVELLKQNESMETDGYVVDYVIAYSLKAPVETPSHSVKRTEKLSTVINSQLQAKVWPKQLIIQIVFTSIKAIRFFSPM